MFVSSVSCFCLEHRCSTICTVQKQFLLNIWILQFTVFWEVAEALGVLIGCKLAFLYRPQEPQDLNVWERTGLESPVYEETRTASLRQPWFSSPCLVAQIRSSPSAMLLLCLCSFLSEATSLLRAAVVPGNGSPSYQTHQYGPCFTALIVSPPFFLETCIHHSLWTEPFV